MSSRTPKGTYLLVLYTPRRVADYLVFSEHLQDSKALLPLGYIAALLDSGYLGLDSLSFSHPGPLPLNGTVPLESLLLVHPKSCGKSVISWPR